MPKHCDKQLCLVLQELNLNASLRQRLDTMLRIGSVLGAILSLLLGLLFICCARTALLTFLRPSPPLPCSRNEAVGYIDTEEAWPRFKKALQFRTVSSAPHEYNRVELRNFVDYLLRSYPELFKSKYVRHDIINEYSLLISVKGENSNLTPYLLAAHLDVVPVVEEEWTFDAFGSPESPDGSMVYGRGAIDVKCILMGQLEALNFLLSKGIQPKRNFFLAFGHDEEVGGKDGAAKIAAELHKRRINKLAFIVDEGLPIVRRFSSSFTKDIAGIGVTEKGSLNLNLTVHSEGGHSSMPPKQTSIGILAAALAKLEANPHIIIFDELTQNFVESMSLDMSFPANVFTSNLWLFKPLIAGNLAKGVTESLIRTTTAVTMIHGGFKQNVIPPSAWAVVNHRIHPKQTIHEIITRNKAIINDDRVTITPLPGSYNPHPISPHDITKDHPYRIIEKTTRQIYPEVVPCPLPLVANTDTVHYLSFTKHIFRMNPIVLDAKTELHRIHGRDERLSKKNFESAMNFYYHLMLNADTEESVQNGHSHSSEL